MGSGTVCRAGRNRSSVLPRHIRALRRGLLLLVSGLFLALLAAPNASAATVYLQPDTDTHGVAQGSTWVTNGSSFWSVLEEASVRPYTPTSADYIYNTVQSGDLAAEVGLGGYTVAGGDQVTLARAHAYVNPATNRALTWQLRTGSTVLATGTATNASGTAWHQIDYTGGLTQAQLDDLRLRFTAGSGTTNPMAVYAAYVEINVVSAPAAPVITGAPLSPGTLNTPQWSWTSDPSAISDECRLERDGTQVYDWAPCTSPASYDLTSLPDGSYEFMVRSKNALNAPGPDDRSTYVIDRTPPAPPTLTATPAGTDNDLNPAWSFTAEAGATVECRLTKGATTVSTWASCASPKTYALGAEISGTFTFAVRARDALSNQGDPTTFDYTLDRDPPTASITGGPTGWTKDSTPTFMFTSEAGATFSCRVEREGVQIIAPTACASGETPDLSSFSDGAFTFFVTATDAVGNPGTELSRSFTLDTAEPAAPTVAGPSGATGDENPEWSFTGEAGAAYECRIDRDAGATVVDDWAPCVSPRSYSLVFPQPDGDYTFRVRAIDSALNVSDEGTRTITLDRVAAADPIITATPPEPSNDDTPVWSFTSDAGTTTECQIEKGAATVLAWTACTAPYTADLTGETDGTFTFRARSVDAAGNRSTGVADTYELDESVPSPPAITASPATEDNDETPTWSFTADPSDATQCQFEQGATVLSAWAPCASPYTRDLTGGGNDGTYTFRVKAIDTATNESTVAAHTFTLDTASPSIPTITGAPAAESNDATPTWTWSADPSTGARCRVERAGTTVIASTPCASGYTPDLSSFSDGSFTLYVRSLDTAQNESLDATSSYVLDRDRPAAPTFTAGPSGPTNDPSPSWSFTAEAGAGFQCQIDRDAGATVVAAWAPCVSPRSYDLTIHPDATYTFRVKAYDAATNEGFEATRTITLDRSAPAAPTITAGPSGPSQNANPSYSFTTEAGSSPECRMDRGATPVQGWEPCASPWSYALTTDGTHTFSVRTSDPAGNTSLVSTRSYDLDRQPPAEPVVTSGPSGPTNDDTPTWAFTVDPGTTECRVQRGSTPVVNWTPCSSGFTPNLAAQADGSFSLRIRTTDAAGNVSSTLIRTFELDRSAPVAPVITGNPPANTSDASASYTFTYEAGATATCQMERGATVVRAWAPCASPRTYDLSAEVDGTYTFRVRATDPAGNPGAIASHSYTLDRVAPNAPTLTARPNANTNNPNVTYAFTSSDAWQFRCQLERNGVAVFAYALCTSPRSYDLSGQADGLYTFRVRANDLSANESGETTDTFALDRSAPAAPTITSGPTGTNQNTAPSYGFTAEAASATACQLERDGTVVDAWSACVSPRSYDITLQPDGVYTFRVRATDAAGNTSTAGTRTYTLDRSAPAAPTVTSGPTANSNDDTPLWAFTGEAGATFTCRVMRGATEIIAPAPCTSPAGYDLSSQIDGTYTFRVKATDAGGLEGPEGTSTYTLDRSPPAAPTITAGPSGPTNGASPTWSFTAEAATATTCRIERGATVVSDWGPCAGSRNYDLSAQPDGTYTFRVRATDAASNTGADTTRSIDLDRSAPAAPMISGWPSGASSDPQPAVTFSWEAGATAQCQIERDGTVIQAYSGCASPATYNFTSEPDGVYTFRVRAVDAAGNVGAVTSGTYELDRVAPPSPTLTARPPAATNNSTATYAFTATDAANFKCRLERSGTVLQDWSNCSSPRSFDLSAQPDAVFTFRVRSVDAANNQSTETSDSFALDRVAPAAPTVTSGPSGPTNGSSPAFGFTAEGGAATACRIERGGTVVDDWAPCVSPRSYDLSLQPDAAYTFRVRATDAAGNTGAEGTRAFTLDRVAPPAPTITAGPTGSSQDDAPTWEWSAEVGAAAACRIMRGATEVIAWTPCTTPQNLNLTAQPDGVYTFEVRATDAANNTGAVAARTYTLDRTPPAAPAIDSAPPADSNDATPTWAFTPEAGSTTTCLVERAGTIIRPWAACSSPHTPDLTGEADGTYTFRVRATDAAGNPGAIASSMYRLDRLAPSAPGVTSGPTGPSQNQDPSFAFTAEAGAATACQLDRDGTVVDAWSACVSPRSYALALFPDGVYTFRVRATDAALNTGAEGTRTYTLDRTAPAAPTITGGPNGPSQVDTPAWSFVAEPGAASECRVMRGTTEVVAWAACTSPQGFDLRGEADGVYTFEVEAIDAAGNRGAAGTRTYTLDRTPPDAPTIDAGPPADSSDDTPTYAFTGEAGAATTCRVERGATVVTNWAPCTSPTTPNLAPQPDGTYTFRVRSTDPAGNVGADAGRSYTLDRNAPSAPTFTGGPADPSKDTTATWAWTAEAGATAECQVQRGATVVSAWASCSSAHTHDLSGQPDGTYDLHVRITDAANNTGAPASRGFRLDTTEPAAPAIDTAPATPTADGTPEWTFSGEAGATFSCQITRGATTVSAWAPCASPKVYDLDGGEPDGTYTFQVRATDAADNTGAPTTSTIDVDRTQPTGVTIDAGPGADGNDNTPTWTFSGDGTGGFRCKLMNGTTEVVPESACTSPRTFDLSLYPDGSYTLEIQSISTSGTRGPVLTSDYRLDTVEPAAPSIDSGPPSLTFDDTPEWAFSAEPSARFECRIDRGTTAVQGWAACSTPQAFDLTNEPDGAYTVSIKAIDAAGNESDPATASYTLDRVPPPTPSFTSEPPSRSSGRSPQWGFTGTGAARYECRVEYGGTTIAAWATCTSPDRVDLAGKADGVYSFSVRAISPAGVPSDPATDTYDLDSGAPDGPTLTATPGPLGNGSRPSWAFTTEPGAALACRLERDGGIVVVDWAACSSPKDFDLAGEPDGLYLFSVRATDDAGNTGAVTTNQHRVDRVPPEPPTVESAPPPVSSTRGPVWSFRAEAGAGIECRLEGPAGVVNDWGACTSPKTFDLTGQPDGAYTLLLRATDPAGNRGGETRSTFTLDATAPGLRIDSGPGPLGRERNVAWAFSGDPDAGFECRLVREAAEVVGWAPCASPNRYDLGGKPDGLYRFWLRARDAAGNPGQQVDAAYELDTTPPREPEITHRPDSPGDDRTPTWRFTGEDEATFSCRVERGTAAVLDWAPCRSPFTADLERAEDGEYEFNVRATDRAGNTGARTTSRYTMQRKQEAPAPTPPRDESGDEEDDDEAAGGTTRRAPAERRPATKPRKPAGKLSKTPVVPPRRKERPGRAPSRPVVDAKPKAEPRNPVSRALGAAVDAARNAAGVVADHPDKSVFPGALLLLVLGFLAVQNRLDRGDPKLALAPDFADPDLEFRPPPGNEP